MPGSRVARRTRAGFCELTSAHEGEHVAGGQSRARKRAGLRGITEAAIYRRVEPGPAEALSLLLRGSRGCRPCRVNAQRHNLSKRASLLTHARLHHCVQLLKKTFQIPRLVTPG